MADENKPKTAVEEIKGQLSEFSSVVKELQAKGQLTEAMASRVQAVEDNLKALEKKTIDRQLSVDGIKDEKQKFDLHMAVKACRTNHWDEAGFEREVIKATHEKAIKIGFRPNNAELLTKDIIVGTGAGGGFLLPVEVDQGIVPLAIAERPVLNDMGITKMTNLSVGEYRINKQVTRGLAYWIGELTAPTKSTQTFDQRILRMKKIAAYTAVSNDILRQGRGSMDAFVRQDLSDALGLGLELALLSGSGSDYQPKGISQYAALTTTVALGTNGAQFGIRDAARMINAIDEANLLKGNLGFVTHPRVMLGLQIQGAQGFSAQTTNTQPISFASPILSKSQLDERLGYKMRTTTQVSKSGTKGTSSDCARVFFGDFRQVVLGMWGGLEVKISDVASDGTNNMFTQDGFFVHVLQTADIVMRDEGAMTIISDARTTTIGETL